MIIDFKTTLIGAAFGLFAFTFIGTWSLAIADDAMTGIVATLVYAEQCDKNDIPPDLLSASKHYQQRNPEFVRRQINKHVADGMGLNPTMWCPLMKKNAGW